MLKQRDKSRAIPTRRDIDQATPRTRRSPAYEYDPPTSGGSVARIRELYPCKVLLHAASGDGPRDSAKRAPDRV